MRRTIGWLVALVVACAGLSVPLGAAVAGEQQAMAGKRQHQQRAHAGKRRGHRHARHHRHAKHHQGGWNHRHARHHGKRKVRLRVRQVSRRSVRITGTVPRRHAHVRIEKRVHGRWKKVARVRAHQHRFKRTVRQRHKRTVYRARSGRKHSKKVALRLRRTAAKTPKSPKAPKTPKTPTATPPTDAGGSVRATWTAQTAQTAPDTAYGRSTDACGPQPLKTDGGLWSCTFHDDFDGTALDRSKWMPQTNFVSGTPARHACYRDDPGNVAVAHGELRLTVRREDTPVPCENRKYGATADYSAGSVMTYHLFSQQYGRFEARIKTAASTEPGLQESFWLWPDDRYDDNTLWPAAGEIDIWEAYSSHPDLAIPFLHYTWYDNWGPRPGLNTAWDCQAPRGVYNTYTLEWSATAIDIYVNGRLCLRNTKGDRAFDKRYIVALTAALGTTGNVPTARTPIPATMKVDYVRVWK